MHQITVTAVRAIRAGPLLAEGTIKVGPVTLAGVRLLDRDGALSLGMPALKDRRHAVGLSADAREAAAQALHAALLGLEGARSGPSGAQTYTGGLGARVP